MSLSSTISILMIGLFFGAGIGYSYSSSNSASLELSMREELIQIGVLHEESKRALEDRDIEINQMILELELERGKVESLGDELTRSIDDLRLRETELQSTQMIVESMQNAFEINGQVLELQTQNLTLHYGDGQRLLASATESARLGNFSEAHSLIEQSRVRFLITHEYQMIMLDDLKTLSILVPEDVYASYAAAAKQSEAEVKLIQAVIIKIDAISLLYTVLDEFSSTEYIYIDDLSRWSGLLNQALVLLGQAEVLLDEGLEIAPAVTVLEAERIMVHGIITQIESFQESIGI